MSGERIERFLAAQGWEDAVPEPLAGDASSRRFSRLQGEKGRAILMDAPLPEHKSVEFALIADRLRAIGLSAPEIYGADFEQGLLLIEDFGDEVFGRLLDRGAATRPLLNLGVDTLIAVHDGGGGDAADGLPVFDAALLLDQSALFPTTFLPSSDAGERAMPAFRRAWEEPLAAALAVPSTLMLRDYFAGNLLHLPARKGVKSCGILDFQDAGLGPVTYDLVSLLDDARRDIDTQDAECAQARHRQAFPNVPKDIYELSCDVLAAQRHVRVLAVFARLAQQGRAGYAVHMPRIWRLLERRIARQPALAEIGRWLAEYCPPERRLPDKLF